jgi:hypothetical protein
VFAPIAAVVFGGGYLAGQAIQQLFHITNASPRACTPDDPNVTGSSGHKYGKSPGDPDWVAYDRWLDSMWSTSNPWGGSENPSSSKSAWQTWKAWSQGNFENWARPLIRQFAWLQSHCAVPPPLDNSMQSTYRFFLGLVHTWNAAAAPGTPMQTLTFYRDQIPGAKWGGAFNANVENQIRPYARDPVQFAIGSGVEQTPAQNATVAIQVAKTSGAAPAAAAAPAPHVIRLSLSAPGVRALVASHATPVRAAAPGSSSGGMSTAGKVATAAAVGGGGALVWWLYAHGWRWVTPRWAKPAARMVGVKG